MKKLFNPFSLELKKQPVQTISSKPIYSNGDYHIYKYVEKHYIYTYKNIVIAERVGMDRQIIDDLVNEKFTGVSEKQWSNYVRPNEAKAKGIEAAKDLKFVVE